MKDYFTKDRVAGYFNGLLTGSDDEFQKLLRKYAICPPNEVNGYRGEQVGTTTVGEEAPTHYLFGSTRNGHIGLRGMDTDHLVAHIELKKMARGTIGETGNEGGDRIHFDASYVADDDRVPVYFLPWDFNGASVRMTIPVRGTNAADPDIFFTAAINGCSIFFQGTAANPTIYHCGGSTGYAKSQIREAIGFWQEVVDDYIAQDGPEGRPDLGGLHDRSVNKSHYITTPGVKSKRDQISQGVKIKSYTTKTALRYQNMLKSKHGISKLTIEEVNPWACVLGRRDVNGDWAFYL